MFSNTLCPAVHISDSENVCNRAEGIADHNWPGPVLWLILLSNDRMHVSNGGRSPTMNAAKGRYYIPKVKLSLLGLGAYPNLFLLVKLLSNVNTR